MSIPVESVAAWLQNRHASASGMKLQNSSIARRPGTSSGKASRSFPSDWKRGRKGQSRPTSSVLCAEAVLQAYGDRSGRWLSELTHREAPWRTARAGLPEEAQSKAEISVELMRSTYAAHRYGTGKHFSEAYLRALELMVELPPDELELLEQTVEPEPTLRSLETGIEA